MAESASIVEPSIAAAVLNLCWPVLQTANQDAHSHNKHSYYDEPGDRGLYHIKSPFRQRHDRDNQLSRVPKVALSSPPMPSPSLSAKMFSRRAHPAGGGTMARAEAIENGERRRMH